MHIIIALLMKLIVGLGNPGRKYENTRHNMGFMVLDRLSDNFQIDIDKDVFHGLLGKGKMFGEDILLFKPTTFMNLSGQAVVEVMNFFKVSLDDLLVVCDDMALDVGAIRLRLKGSSGGQKGLQNIIDLLGSEDFKRLRVGIGRPEYDTIDYVLGKPSEDERPLILDALDNAVEAIKVFLKVGFEKAMNDFNSLKAS